MTSVEPNQEHLTSKMPPLPSELVDTETIKEEKEQQKETANSGAATATGSADKTSCGEMKVKSEEEEEQAAEIAEMKTESNQIMRENLKSMIDNFDLDMEELEAFEKDGEGFNDIFDDDIAGEDAKMEQIQQ